MTEYEFEEVKEILFENLDKTLHQNVVVLKVDGFQDACGLNIRVHYKQAPIKHKEEFPELYFGTDEHKSLHPELYEEY